MSMTRGEAIKQLKSLYDHCENMRSGDNDFAVWERDCEAIKIAITALHPVSREQVENVWRGEWDSNGPQRYCCVLQAVHDAAGCTVKLLPVVWGFNGQGGRP